MNEKGEYLDVNGKVVPESLKINDPNLYEELTHIPFEGVN